MQKIGLRELRKAYLEQLELTKKARAIDIARMIPAGTARAGEFLGPLVGKTVGLGIQYSPYIAAGAIGVKGYQGGKRKLQEHKYKKQLKEMQKQQYAMYKGGGAPIDWKTVAVLGAALPAVGAATAGAVEGIRRLYYAAKKGRDFNNMLEANPALAQEADMNPKGVRMAFDTMHRLNPQLAAEPLVAGTFVRKTLDSQLGGGGMHVDPATAKMLADSYMGRVSPVQAAMSTALTIPKAVSSRMLKGTGEEEEPSSPEREQEQKYWQQ